MKQDTIIFTIFLSAIFIIFMVVVFSSPPCKYTYEKQYTSIEDTCRSIGGKPNIIKLENGVTMWTCIKYYKNI